MASQGSSGAFDFRPDYTRSGFLWMPVAQPHNLGTESLDIHKILCVFSRNFMDKLVYKPLPVLVRAQPSNSRWTCNSAKILRAGATLGTVFALCGAVVICLIGFRAFTPVRFESKGSAGIRILPETNVLPTTPADQDNGIGR